MFKVDRTANGERTAYVRMVQGTVRAREVLRFRGPDGQEGEGRVSAVSVFENGREVPVPEVRAGRIGRLKGRHPDRRQRRDRAKPNSVR